MFTKRSALLLIMTIVFGAAVAGPSAPLQDIVQTDQGPVRGVGDGIIAFKGIPYAAPPVGALRWRPPASPARWTAVRNATQFGPECTQPAGFVPRGRVVVSAVSTQTSEDCLTLNVWTPAQSVGERLPVMMWLHGGGFTVGSGSQRDATALARHGVVVVGVNYRLGALGFLAHPALSKESPHGVSGNYGLLDQLAALRWVQANIASFGGDPGNVTLVGQSAGATSIGVMLISPLARGLFHRAIIESVGGSYFGPKRRLRESFYGMSSAEADGADRVANIETFRALPAEELLARLPSAPTIVPGAHYYPIIDGYVLPDEPETLLNSRGVARVPVLIGHNADEGLFFAGDGPKTLAEYRNYIRTWLPPQLFEEVLARYPASGDEAARTEALRLTGDYRIVAPTTIVARKLASVTDVYMYRFSRVSPFSRAMWGGAAHVAEIPYVFGLVANPAQYDAIDRELSATIAGAWAQFAKTGNPNGPGLPRWPIYRPGAYQTLEFGDVVTMGSNANDPNIEFFQHAYEVLRAQQPVR